jgi:beta-glucanase (GH16 family)
MLPRRALSLVMILALIAAGMGLIGPATPARAADPIVVDDFEASLAAGQDGTIPVGFFTAQGSNSSVAFSRAAAPTAVPEVPDPNNVLKMDFTVASYGVLIHSFENDAANQWVAQDWSAYEGVSFWLYGNNSGIDLFVDVLDNRGADLTRDQAERFSVAFKDNWSGWKKIELPFASLTRKDVGNGAPNDGFTLTDVHGWAFGTLATGGTRTFYMDNVTLYGTAPERPLTVGFAQASTDVQEGQTGHVTVRLSKAADVPITVKYTAQAGLATAARDFTATSGTLTFAPGIVQRTFDVATLDDAKYEGDESILLQLADPTVAVMGVPPVARLNIRDNDPYDPALLDDFETPPYMFSASNKTALASREIAAGAAAALPGQGAYERVLEATRSGGGQSALEFGRRFAQGQDWSADKGLSFWYYGKNSGRKITVNLLDNAAPDPGPAGWRLAWSDEFNTAAGAQPNPKTWGYEIGDGTVNGIPGWGNDELEYYTDSPQNVATNGSGSLVITARQADGTQQCYYGPCKYTSARLLSKNRFEFAYGRIESRIKVPRGAGLWPAFWSLGSDIDQVGWPQTGEIDFMEHVARLPDEVFGTIHGPGYSGGQSFGGIYDLGLPVADDFHTYAVEWQPGAIRWYIDGILYHTARPSDVAPNQWVFDHPFFILLNMAIGGNFGGAVGADTTFPQSMTVDYVRLYQAPDTAERFGAEFTDNFSGWRRVSLPFSTFTRSALQPAGAPSDGLNLTSVSGYGFTVPGNYPAPVLIDQVRLLADCDDPATVTTTADDGAGSLRRAISRACAGGMIEFAPGLAGQTIGLTSAELTIAKNLTIDGAGAPGLTISGSGTVRPFVIDPTATATVRNLRIANGYGFQLAGGVLNNGTLTLDHVVVEGNNVTTDGEAFWKGGAGVYSGEDSTLALRDSTVAGNTAAASNGGGVLAMFRATVLVERSTISGNSANVGGGLRTLGNVRIVNSTISGNSTYGWMGGAFFHTDGVMNVVNSTIANNTAPPDTTGGAFVGTFTDASATLTLVNTILSGNSGPQQCFYAPWGAGVVTATSLGHNLVADNSCFAVASDIVGADPQLGALADNGGPTRTHALAAGSPALNAADPAASPAVDQRGTSRPQGAGPDIGSYERAAP